MALSAFFGQPIAPSQQTTVADYANQAAQLRQQQAMQQNRIQGERDALKNSRRKMAISVLGGLANEADPERQSALYATIKPMAERYDPTLRLPEQYDPSLTRVLMGTQVDPADMMRAQAQQAGKLPTGYRMNPQTQQAELIPGIDPISAFGGSTGALVRQYMDATGENFPDALKATQSRAQSTSAAEEKISRIQQSVGVDRETAVKIADGVVKVVTDPVSGRSSIIDLSTAMRGLGEPEQLPPQAAPSQPPGAVQQTQSMPEERQSLYSLADKTAGMTSGLRSLWNSTAAQIPGIPADEQTESARQTMGLASNELIRSLSINPRFPVGEIERLEKEVNISPASWDSTPALRARMRSLDTYLRNRHRDALTDASNASLPADIRKAQISNASAIESFLRVLDVPQSGSTQQQGAKSLDDIFGF